MSFHSILWEASGSQEDAARLQREARGGIVPEPSCFSDLRLDRVVASIVGDAEQEYGLNRHFRELPGSLATVLYRQDVMRALADGDIHAAMRSFSLEMRRMRVCTDHAKRLHVPDARRKWMLDGAVCYGNAAVALEKALRPGAGTPRLCSEGLLSLHVWLSDYVSSEWFRAFHTESCALQVELEGIRYAVEVGKDRVTVHQDECDPAEDYAGMLAGLFSRLSGKSEPGQKSGVPDAGHLSFFTDLEMGLLEIRILAVLEKNNPVPFTHLSAWCRSYADGDNLVPSFVHAVLNRFDREIQFYLSVIAFTKELGRRGFCFSMPEVGDRIQHAGAGSDNRRRLMILDGYDLALAIREGTTPDGIVPNDCRLEDPERQMILTGPNQGGKTTYGRMLGQILWLASLGCPVPCRKAEVWLCDGIFTHFSVEEDMEMQSGRLQEELRRLGPILSQAGPDSLVVLNELFSTTTVRDALAMGQRILDQLDENGCFCLYVTHAGDLAKAGRRCVSLVAEVRSDNPDIRTFRVVRRPADGYAGAHAIARKYRLDYPSLKERLNA